MKHDEKKSAERVTVSIPHDLWRWLEQARGREKRSTYIAYALATYRDYIMGKQPIPPNIIVSDAPNVSGLESTPLQRVAESGGQYGGTPTKRPLPKRRQREQPSARLRQA
jgi:hypothetical protein